MDDRQLSSAHGSLPSSEEPLPSHPLSFGLTGLAGELRHRGGEGWPSLIDSLPQPAEGLNLIENHYMNPLFRVLCSDGPDLGTVVTTGSRAEVIHRWAPNNLFTQNLNPTERLGIFDFPTD